MRGSLGSRLKNLRELVEDWVDGRTLVTLHNAATYITDLPRRPSGKPRSRS
jgi:hypothetical protein